VPTNPAGAPGIAAWTSPFPRPLFRRTQRSTKQEDKDKAWKVCLDWADAERKAGQGLLTEAQARRVISEIVERTAGEPLHFYTAERLASRMGSRQTSNEIRKHGDTLRASD